jgi:hypothetical protein
MSKRDFAFGEGAKPRHAWSRCISTLPVNKPVLWTAAAVVFSVFAVGFMAASSKVTQLSSRPATALPQPYIVAQAFEELDTSEPVAPTVAVRPVAPMIFLRPPDPAPQAGTDAATTGTADSVAPAARERTGARVDSSEGWPKTTGSKVMASSAIAPLECLPEALRTVLNEVLSRFGGVTIVSTTQLQTDNHSPGSARANMHTACKAVDIKTTNDPNDVLAYLRSRPEVGGVNTYRNRVIHFDLNPGYQAASARSRTAQPRRTAIRVKRHPRVPASAMARQSKAETVRLRASPIVRRETPAVQ